MHGLRVTIEEPNIGGVGVDWDWYAAPQLIPFVGVHPMYSNTLLGSVGATFGTGVPIHRYDTVVE